MFKRGFSEGFITYTNSSCESSTYYKAYLFEQTRVLACLFTI